MLLGTLLVAEAVVTYVWQEPFTSLWTAQRQRALSGDLDALMRGQATVPIPVQRRLARLPDPDARVAYLAARMRRSTSRGDAVGRLRIPRAGTDPVIVRGDDPGDLRDGPGIYDRSPFPGERGTVAIAGHRTTYNAPFRNVDRLRPGDPITLEMPYARFTYRVTGHRIVAPEEVSVVRRVGHDRLVLTACHPVLSSAQRYVVFAALVRTEPR